MSTTPRTDAVEQVQWGRVDGRDHGFNTIYDLARTLERELAEAVENAESAQHWNRRVSVCSEHTGAIVDGPCVVCARDRAIDDADHAIEIARKVEGAKRDEIAVYAELLLPAAEMALAHVVELRDAWERGCLSERDGRGGTRSNRNVEVEVALRDAISKNPNPSGRFSAEASDLHAAEASGSVGLGSDAEGIRNLVVGGAQSTQAGSDSGGMPLSVGRSRPDQTATTPEATPVGGLRLDLVEQLAQASAELLYVLQRDGKVENRTTLSDKFADAVVFFDRAYPNAESLRVQGEGLLRADAKDAERYRKWRRAERRALLDNDGNPDGIVPPCWVMDLAMTRSPSDFDAVIDKLPEATK